MAILTKYASAHTAITTGYTNPTNAYADDGTNYATAAPGAKNTEVSAYWGFPAFSTSDIPDGATINSVTVEHEFKTSTTSSIATEYIQVFVNTSAVGSEQSNNTEPAADTRLDHQVTTGVTLTNLRTADVVRARTRSLRGNSATAVTFSLDFVRVTVDYTAQQNLTLTCEVTNYSVTGQVTTLTLNRNYTLACEVTNYAITPQDVTFTKALTLNCEVTNYTITPQDVTLTVAKNYTLSCEVANYSVTPQDIAFVLQRNYTLACEVTAYTITGQDITLTYAQEITLLNAVKSLVYSANGSPWARISVSSTIGVDSLIYSKDGSPWWGVQPSALTWTAKPLKYYTGSTWTAGILKYYSGGSWIAKDLKTYI